MIEEKWCHAQNNVPGSGNPASGRGNASDPPRELYLGLLYSTEQHKVGKTKADAKTTPSYNSDLHLSVLQNRPDRGGINILKMLSTST